MKVIRVEDLEGTDREVRFPVEGFASLRFLLADDKMGFTVCETRIPKGTSHYWYYKRHLEACYCVKGKAIVKDLRSSKEWQIEPGTCYVLDDHDPHEFIALEDVILVSVFNPPLKGSEIHDEEGSY